MSGDKTLVFLKPDAVVRRYVGARLLEELTKGATVNQFKEVSPPREFIAQDHYGEHEGRHFFDWLVDYVDTSPLLVLELEAEGVTGAVRRKLGGGGEGDEIATLPNEAPAASLRGRYGIYGGLNAAHASEDSESAADELALWESHLSGADESPNERLEEYVDRYIDHPMIDPVRYRELTESFIEGSLSADSARTRFLSLLSKESNCSADVISALADVMVDNARLEDR